MKFYKPANFTQRCKTRFLLFPRKIKNEIKWLEKASWVEHYFDGIWWGEKWIDEDRVYEGYKHKFPYNNDGWRGIREKPYFE